ncbi:ribosome-associated translation inhibitor RaiA [soil metagenome]
MPTAAKAIPASFTGMNVTVSGKHMDVGDALRTRITDELQARVGKYFDEARGNAGGEADVFVGKEGHSICVDLVLRLSSGQRLVAQGMGADAHAAFDTALIKVETRIRRYKQRLTNHHPHMGGASKKESMSLVVFSSPDEADDLGDDEYGYDGSAGAGKPGAAIIAESQSELKTMTVSMAVMELDLTEAPVVMFRNAAHGGLSVVYRRPDQNIGWIDPQRTVVAASIGRA